VGRGEDEIVWLKAGNFLEINLGPILRGIDDGDAAGAAQGIGYERVSADGDERLGPNGEEHALRGQSADTVMQVRETALQVGSYQIAGFGSAQDIGQFFGRGNNSVDSVRVDGVGGNSEVVEGINGFQAIQTFCHENEIRMQRGNLFEAGIDGAADFCFCFGVGRVVAVVGVADEAVLEAESVDGFREAGCEGNDAADRLWDAHGAASFVGDFAKQGSCSGSCRRSRLSKQGRSGAEHGGDRDADCGLKARD